MFRQPELAATLRKLVEAEKRALARGASRKQAIMAAYERFYRGDIAVELAAAVQAQGGLITREDLARWQVKIEEPRHVNYRGIDVLPCVLVGPRGGCSCPRGRSPARGRDAPRSGTSRPQPSGGISRPRGRGPARGRA